MIPGPDHAPVASKTNVFPAESSTVDANASCLCAECIESQADYAQSFGGCFDVYDPSWSPPIPCPDRVYLHSTREQ